MSSHGLSMGRITAMRSSYCLHTLGAKYKMETQDQIPHEDNVHNLHVGL